MEVIEDPLPGILWPVCLFSLSFAASLKSIDRSFEWNLNPLLSVLVSAFSIWLTFVEPDFCL